MWKRRRPVGDFSLIVKVAVPPASVVFPLIADTVMPEASLSVFATDTSFGSRPL